MKKQSLVRKKTSKYFEKKVAKRRAKEELIKALEKIATRLDKAGKYSDADAIDNMIIRFAEDLLEKHTDESGKVWTKVGPAPTGGIGRGFVIWKDQEGNQVRFPKDKLPGPQKGVYAPSKPQPGLLEKSLNAVEKEVDTVQNIMSDKPLHEKVNPEGAEQAANWLNSISN